MGNFLTALQTNDKRTLNGMLTHSTSSNACVDLFSRIGALRGKDFKEVINLFIKALEENSLTAMKILFWSRDIRGGAGERENPRRIFKYLANNRTDLMAKNLHLISEFGRWDDLFHLIDTPLKTEVLDLIADGFEKRDGLLAKWLPRPNHTNKTKKMWTNAIRNRIGLDPKTYRKALVEMSSTVEQLMCAKEWTSIEYGKVPSKAMSDYMKAFGRHDSVGFTNYLNSVEKGVAKINAGAVYPYDIIKSLKYGNSKGASTQWSALPNYLEGNTERVFPMVDVSGSMETPAGGSRVISCMDVAISLGLYLSERNVGPFKDGFLTFSSTPQLVTTHGSLTERYNQMSRGEWGMSTDLEAAFNLILNKAVESNVSSEDMPTMLIIFSDMQFNYASKWDVTAQKMIQKKYENAGYEMPKIVYWNLNAINSDSPVKFHETNAGLVSGFSPSLLKSILSGKSVTPFDMMMETIGSTRYDVVTV